ncbi:RarD protein [Saprolegnia diclina VS20]|uniref:RarD protein n=1 Tax=Saprolegnia diclina (strain VS20) TaxID=1156394 RepID=T0RGT9_SAPDV|nr:RarD protein [Saprolegnia diclina VS20]EQC28997.1 RarD protein [Saprolegnia diclina VS20]|eukprot:XP_008617636.1 RarD protein [Saprolegnia diclina VS20]
MSSSAASGVAFGFLAYMLWGFQPAYWKLLEDMDSYQLAMHRVVWSGPIVLLVLAVRRDLPAFAAVLRQKAMYQTYAVTALLLSANFFLSLWAVNVGYVLQMSLGFFINPLVTVLLGVVFLHESLAQVQWCAIGLAAIGVVVVTVGEGEFPSVALSIAFVNGVFVLLRKLAPLNGLLATAMEISMMTVPAAMYLVWCEVQGTGVFGHVSFGSELLIVGCGAWSVVPLLLLSLSIDRIPLVILGVLQFIGPTLNTLLGLFAFGEVPSQSLVIGFTCVVLALIVFTYTSLSPPTKGDEKAPLLPQKAVS